MTVTTIEATYRVTTPMFCGGADGGSAELREASFKGVLRFWWRACAWSHFDRRLERIREAEASLFGSPQTGQSKVWVRLAPEVRMRPRPRSGAEALGRDGTRYLGLGLRAMDGSKVRDCLPAPFDFTARLLCRDLDEARVRSVEDAVRALGMLGGMGARSRRGYGSLSLTRLRVDGEDRPVPSTPRDLDAALRRLYEAAAPDLPEYTALSGQSRHLVLECGEVDAAEVLNLLGIEYAEYRRRARGTRWSGELKGDYRIALEGKPSDAYPKRIAFGLPLNFDKGKLVRPAGHDRRASPLLFHIHWCESRAVAVVSFLPARFLPGDTPVVILANGHRRHIDTDSVYQPVLDFLDYLEQESTFTPVRQVRR